MIGHINVYSCYSFQNSTILIEDLCKRASQLNIQCLALTDINNMYGALEFYHACKKYQIKPIFGSEISVEIDHQIYPFTILAKDNTGYHDLVRIVSDINLSDNKCITLEGLSIYKEHLFIIAARDSIIVSYEQRELQDQAEEKLKLLKNIFNESFYVGLLNFGDELNAKTNEKIISLCAVHDVKICASNEVRYLRQEDALTLELLQKSRDEQTISNLDVVYDQKYLKSSYEMDLLFSSKIIDNTNYILRACNVEITHEMHLPKYPLSEGKNSKDYLYALCKICLKKRFNHQEIPTEYKQRLIKELNVINKMGFNDYFLIVFDYVQFAKSHDILVGPGRGSAAGSLVSYVLGITNVDPLKYDLLFERFLNEERVSMPDIDIDFQDDRRDEIVSYVTKKYNQEHVGQIVTFSTYGPRIAIRDIGKTIGVSAPALDRIAKFVPTGPKDKKSINEVYKTSFNFQNLIKNIPMFKEILPSLDIIERLPRNISMHAAGVVLSGDDLRDVVPLTKGPSNSVVTQYSKDYIEEVGLLKMDFLGLKNLTIISNILKEVERVYNKKIDIKEIELDDFKTYELLRHGDTFGVFQLESSGMTNLIVKMKCDCLDDIIAALALYRPGPMKNIPTYLKRKFKEEKVNYPLECLKDILEPTYGILIYQEQIMQVATRVAGFSLAKADILRKAMSKKTASLMASMKDEFVEGAISNGFTKKQGEDVFDLIERFANYGFNKSHSVAYGIIAYQLAYLKAHYPLEFYCALLSNDQSSDKNKLRCKQECDRQGIKILPPSINHSKDRFISEGNNIRYSLMAIKGFGIAGYTAIIEERKLGEFKSFDDFLERTNKKISTAMIDSLVYAGCFDEFDNKRLNLIESYPSRLQYITMKTTFGEASETVYDPVYEDKYVRLEKEKEVLGIYLSSHPLSIVKGKYDNIIDVSLLGEYIDKSVRVILTLSRVKFYEDRKGQDMAFIEGNDDTGNIDGVVFASTFRSIKDQLVRGNIVLIEGKINYRDKLSLIVNKLEKIR